MKNHNILRKPENIALVTNVYRCPMLDCDRTLVTYKDGLDASKHMNGLPKPILDAVMNSQVASVILSVCDHHGGVAFRPDSDYTNPELPGAYSHLISRVLLGEPGITPRTVDGLRHELEARDVNPRVLDGVIL